MTYKNSILYINKFTSPFISTNITIENSNGYSSNSQINTFYIDDKDYFIIDEVNDDNSLSLILLDASGNQLDTYTNRGTSYNYATKRVIQITQTTYTIVLYKENKINFVKFNINSFSFDFSYNSILKDI